jgi:hypothetical protein
MAEFSSRHLQCEMFDDDATFVVRGMRTGPTSGSLAATYSTVSRPTTRAPLP